MSVYPFPPGNAIWAPVDLAALVCQPGCMSPDDWRPVTAVAVLLSESGGNPLAVRAPIWRPATREHLSMAVGLCQLLTAMNVDADPYPTLPRITIAACLDPFQAWAHTWKLINHKRSGWTYDWANWSGFTSGSYKQREPDAAVGVKAYRALMS